MWTNCRLKIAYCYGLQTWIFDQTPWTDGDHSYDPHTSVDGTTLAWEQHCQCRPPMKLSHVAAAAVVSFNREDVEWAKYKRNKATSDATIKAHVVMSFACVEWHSIVRSPTGR